MARRPVDRLAGIDAKLDRAEQQIKTLKEFWATWPTREKAYRLVAQIDEGKRRYIWQWCVVKPLPPEPALLMDEIIHHLRSALDHLAAYLVEACGGKPTQATKWPFEGSRWGWERNVEGRNRRWQIWRKDRGGPLGGIPRSGAVWAFIETTQPYRAGGKAREHPLFGLNESWNANKHRILNPVWPEATPAGKPIALFDVTPPIEPIESRWIVS